MKKYKFIYRAITPYVALNIAEDVVNLLNENKYEDITEAILEEMDSSLIYDGRQWQVLMTYCLPENADLHFATNKLFDDIYACIEEVEEER